MITQGVLVKQFRSLLDTAEKRIADMKYSILDKQDFIRIAGGRRVNIPDLDAPAQPLLHFIREMKALRVSQDNMQARLAELNRVMDPVFDFYRRVYRSLSEMAEAVKAPKAAGFQESKAASIAGEVTVKEKVKMYPASPGRGKSEMNNTMKIFKDGRWQYLETRGEATAERAKAIQKENPALDFGECLIAAEKETLAKEERDGDEKHFSEVALQEFAERFPGVPVDAIAKLKDAKRCEAVTLSDGTSWMKICQNGMERILPVSNEGAEVIPAFQDEKNFQGRDRVHGHFIPSKKPVEKKIGYSADRKTFTDRSGQTMEVYTGSDAEISASEVEIFMRNFVLEFNAAGHVRDREGAAKKAIQLLRDYGITPDKVLSQQAEWAIRAAASTPEKFDTVSRYVRSGEFSSFEKSVVAALA